MSLKLIETAPQTYLRKDGIYMSKTPDGWRKVGIGMSAVGELYLWYPKINLVGKEIQMAAGVPHHLKEAVAKDLKRMREPGYFTPPTKAETLKLKPTIVESSYIQEGEAVA